MLLVELESIDIKSVFDQCFRWTIVVHWRHFICDCVMYTFESMSVKTIRTFLKEAPQVLRDILVDPT